MMPEINQDTLALCSQAKAAIEYCIPKQILSSKICKKHL